VRVCKEAYPQETELLQQVAGTSFSKTTRSGMRGLWQPSG
jgi:hypothetical protein